LRADLAELAKQLAAAHGLTSESAEIKSFRAQVIMDPRQEQAVAFEVKVDFQAPRSLRCELIEKGIRVERGFDPKLGAWAISGDEVVKLQGPTHNKDADQIARDLRLCQQIARLLSPHRLLASLQDPSAVQTADLDIHRLHFKGCTVVAGTVASIPTYAAASDGPARVMLYMHPQTKQLLAVQVVPLGEGDKPSELAELVLLDEYSETRGVRLPTKLNVYRIAGPGLEILMTVKILAIELDKQFGSRHFARPTLPTK
jgi:hypothetical protein